MMQNSSSKPRYKPGLKPCPTPPRFAGEMLGVLTEVMSVESPDMVLQKIASTIADLFAMRRLVIGVLDEPEQIYRVRVAHGYEGEREKKIRKFTYSQERMKTDMNQRYKIAENVYLVRQAPEDMIKGEEPFYTNLAQIHEPRTDPSIWHELDYLRFVFMDRRGTPIGFIEINESVSDKIPDSETIEAMQIFSQLAGVAIENAAQYQRQFEIAQRSRFLSDIIAHDINNYNQAVTSYLQMAIDGLGPNERTVAYLERAAASAWGISGLIQRANKLIRIEEEGAESLGPLELGEVLKECVDEVTRNNADKTVRFDVKLGTHRYFVMGNELANEIFSNILENAVTYDPHEVVQVDVTIGEFTVEPRRYWCVSIADHGIGIPDSKKNVVFGRFITGDERPHSIGLGLTTVRALVEAYHGMVWVEDRVPGDPSKGSIFRVALPMVSTK
jgi:signal transduction histidine kinase